MGGFISSVIKACPDTAVLCYLSSPFRSFSRMTRRTSRSPDEPYKIPPRVFISHPDFFNVSCARVGFSPPGAAHADTGNKKLAGPSMNSALWYAVSWHSRNSVISVRRARSCLLGLYKGCNKAAFATRGECCRLRARSPFARWQKHPARSQGVLWLSSRAGDELLKGSGGFVLA